ncbi:MAG TPA: endonuclease/exonuclease/phosphatase family protein [Ilumatobacteraceae bacterium]|nr:endonuclease/exonuclease/phosphatase family protein [Ilumatobacteraceae bacterium]
MNDALWTVMTWNVHGSHEPDPHALATAIQAEAPDVVVVQEIRRRQADAVASALSMRYSWALKHAPYTRLLPSRYEGMAIMTPHAIGAAAHSEISDDVGMRSWRRRIAQWALIGRPDRSLMTVVNLHLSPHDDAEARRREAQRVGEIVERIGDEQPTVVAGDFNDADDPTIVDLLPGVEHVEPAPTNPAAAPTQVLDHVLLPPAARDVAVTVPAGGDDWAAISDHLPVTVRFRLPSALQR